MKTIIASLLGTLLYLGSLSSALAQAPTVLKDTLSIQIGKDKKVIILVKDKEALKALENYDLNKMVRDLNQKVDSLDNSKTIIITDEDGNRYRIAFSVEKADTAKVKDKDDEKNINIVFGNKDKDKHKERHYSRTRSSFMIELGMNNYLQDYKFPQDDNAQYAVKSWGSWYVGFNWAYTTQIAGPLALQWGAGLNWYNFKFEDPKTRLIKTPEGIEFIQEANADVYSEKSKLTASYVNIQAIPMLDFGYKKKTVTKEDGSTKVSRWHNDEAFRIGLGGYAGYRLGSYTKYKFEVDHDDKKDRKRDSYYLNNLRYGVRMQVGYKGLDLFAQYDLNELFTENKGPQLNAFSFGIII